LLYTDADARLALPVTEFGSLTVEDSHINWALFNAEGNHGSCQLGDFCLFKSEIVELSRLNVVSTLLSGKYTPMKNLIFEQKLMESETKFSFEGWNCEAITQDHDFKNDSNSFTLHPPIASHFGTWLYSSLADWCMLKELLLQASRHVLEVTFDMNIMTAFNRVMILHGILPIWREKKSMASSRERTPDTKDKKIDCTVLHKCANGREYEVLLFESSMCTGNRDQHRDQDYVKLSHAVVCATRDMLKVGSFMETGCVGIQLYQDVNQAVRLRGIQCRLNTIHKCWELHLLFDISVPLAILDTASFEESLVFLQHMFALAKMVKDFPNLLARACEKESAKAVSAQQDEKGDDTNKGSDEDSLPRVAARPTPTKGTIPLKAAIATRYSLDQWENGSRVALCGAFASVFPAKCLNTEKEVVLKLQEEAKDHMRELHSLHSLQGVQGVVQLLDFFSCDEGYVIVLPRLSHMNYDSMRSVVGSSSHSSSSLERLRQFSQQILNALSVMHYAGWAHCDIKPSAIMMMRTEGTQGEQCIFSDFNLARRASSQILPHQGLPGTPGWVFDGSPAHTAVELDRIGLAAVIGWLLGMEGYGDADTSYAEALRTVQLEKQKEGDRLATHILLVNLVEALLFPHPSLQTLVGTMPATVKLDTRRGQVSTNKENCTNYVRKKNIDDHGGHEAPSGEVWASDRRYLYARGSVL
jgi:hypothetical protein